MVEWHVFQWTSTAHQTTMLLTEFHQADQPSFTTETGKWQKDADIIKKTYQLLKLSKREIMIRSIMWQNVLNWSGVYCFIEGFQ